MDVILVTGNYGELTVMHQSQCRLSSLATLAIRQPVARTLGSSTRHLNSKTALPVVADIGARRTTPKMGFTA